MRGIGLGLLALAALAAIYAFLMDTTVPAGEVGRVHNVGLLGQRQNVLLLAGFLGVIGAILLAASQRSTTGTTVRVGGGARIFLGIVAGIVVGLASAAGIGFLGDLLFPSGLTVERYTAAAAAEIFPRLPFGAQLLSILSWGIAALIGASLAKKIAGRSWTAWTVAGFFVAYVALTLLVLPMPGWMQAVAIVGPVIGGFVANRIVADRPVVATPAEAFDDADL